MTDADEHAEIRRAVTCGEARAEAALCVPAGALVEHVTHLREPLEIGIAQGHERAVTGRLREARGAPELTAEAHSAIAQRQIKAARVADFRSEEERAVGAADAALGAKLRT